MENDDEPVVCVGQFGGSYAVQGWVKVTSFTDPDDAIFSYQPWLVETRFFKRGKATVSLKKESDNSRADFTALELSGSRRHGRGFVVKLVGIDNPEQAKPLAGASIYVARDKLPLLSPGEYYWVDLIGLTVENQSGRQLGKVSEILETGANDVLVVSSDKADDILIPYVIDHYVLKIDLDEQKIIVDWDWDE